LDEVKTPRYKSVTWGPGIQTYQALTTATQDETLRIPDDFARSDTKRSHAAQKAPNVKEGME